MTSQIFQLLATLLRPFVILIGIPKFKVVQRASLSQIQSAFLRSGRDLQLLRLMFDEAGRTLDKVEENHDGLRRSAAVFMGAVGILIAVIVGFGRLAFETSERLGAFWSALSWGTYALSLAFLGAGLFLAALVFERIPRFNPSLNSKLDIGIGYESFLMMQTITTVNAIESNHEINDWKALCLRRAMFAWRVGVLLLVAYGLTLGIAGLLGCLRTHPCGAGAAPSPCLAPSTMPHAVSFQNPPGEQSAVGGAEPSAAVRNPPPSPESQGHPAPGDGNLAHRVDVSHCVCGAMPRSAISPPTTRMRALGSATHLEPYR